jgi:hypothetical protein
MARLTPFVAAISAGMVSPWWVPLAAAAIWMLPDWVVKWLDVRDRWQSQPR